MIGNSNKLQGFAGTIIVHSIAIALLLLLTFSSSLPDEANEGLLINFGNSEDGSGKIEPMVNYENAVMISLPSHIKPPKIDEKKILTQDFEDAPSIEAKKKTPKKEIKKNIPQKVTENTTPKKQKEEVQTTEPVKQQTVNKKALFPGKSSTGGTTGEGITGKEGNQGSLEGSPESINRVGGASGNNGIGDGNGKEINYNLGGRRDVSLPKPDYLKQKQGIVVVQVTVDKQGNVIKAVPGVKGSTTLDNDLLKAAEKAALMAKFDSSSNAPAYQMGTIIYIFKFQ